MKLFLDDERKPRDVTWVELPLGPWYIVRSFYAFVEYIHRNGLPEFISFDCDLHEEHYPWHAKTQPYFELGKLPYHLYKYKTGRDCAMWLVDYCKQKNLDIPPFTVHSMNVVARAHVHEILTVYTKSQSLTEEEKKTLQQLEYEIYNAGVYGGEHTSYAIDALYTKEKELGVFTEHRNTPTWLENEQS